MNSLQGIESKKFIGGAVPHSYWMTKERVMTALDELGMTVAIVLNDCNHTAGSSIPLYVTSVPNFNEAGYVERNPDVAQTMENKQFQSGAERYIRFGRAEGRGLSDQYNVAHTGTAVNCPVTEKI